MASNQHGHNSGAATFDFERPSLNPLIKIAQQRRRTLSSKKLSKLVNANIRKASDVASPLGLHQNPKQTTRNYNDLLNMLFNERGSSTTTSSGKFLMETLDDSLASGNETNNDEYRYEMEEEYEEAERAYYRLLSSNEYYSTLVPTPTHYHPQMSSTTSSNSSGSGSSNNRVKLNQIHLNFKINSRATRTIINNYNKSKAMKTKLATMGSINEEQQQQQQQSQQSSRTLATTTMTLGSMASESQQSAEANNEPSPLTPPSSNNVPLSPTTSQVNNDLPYLPYRLSNKNKLNAINSRKSVLIVSTIYHTYIVQSSPHILFTSCQRIFDA